MILAEVAVEIIVKHFHIVRIGVRSAIPTTQTGFDAPVRIEQDIAPDGQSAFPISARAVGSASGYAAAIGTAVVKIAQLSVNAHVAPTVAAVAVYPKAGFEAIGRHSPMAFAAIVVPIRISSYNPQIQISAESETKRSIFREKDKTKRSKKESAQHSKSRNKSFVMTSVSAL